MLFQTITFYCRICGDNDVWVWDMRRNDVWVRDMRRQSLFTVRYVETITFYCQICGDNHFLLSDMWRQSLFTVRYVETMMFECEICVWVRDMRRQWCLSVRYEETMMFEWEIWSNALAMREKLRALKSACVKSCVDSMARYHRWRKSAGRGTS